MTEVFKARNNPVPSSEESLADGCSLDQTGRLVFFGAAFLLLLLTACVRGTALEWARESIDEARFERAEAELDLAEKELATLSDRERVTYFYLRGLLASRRHHLRDAEYFFRLALVADENGILTDDERARASDSQEF